MRHGLYFTSLILFGLGTPLSAARAVDYMREVKPLLAARCTACHGALQQKGDLRVDTVQALRAGGSRGPALVPGRSSESLLIARVSAAGKQRMPPEADAEALTETEIELLRKWIDQGAPGPADEQPEPDPRTHWAFRAPVRPAVPQPPGHRHLGNPVDAFLESARTKRGLTPQPPADRRTLLRRVYLDLIGLPPTREELHAFLADGADDAYERMVDRLLAAPHYGERWGRHWMDVWRYSDWWGLGDDARNSHKHMYHWRDWIVESLNADRGYDEMLRQMLAADELYPNDLDRLRATGFLARQYFKFNRNSWMEETVEHTAKAFLGLTLNCARCHDHKYDPVTQSEYFSFRAFFEPYQVRIDQVPGEVDLEKDGIPRAFDCNLDAPTYRFLRGDERQPLKDRPLAPSLPRLLSTGPLDIQPVALPLESYAPSLRPFVAEDHQRAAQRQVETARKALDQSRQALAESEKNTAGQPALAQARATTRLAAATLDVAEAHAAAVTARAAADRARWQTPPAAEYHERARAAVRAERALAFRRALEALARAEVEFMKLGPEKKGQADRVRARTIESIGAAWRAFNAPADAYTPLSGALKSLESNVETEESRRKPFPTTSTGRRTALARWLTDRRNPLTARVAVNHVWTRHFGQPLVPTIFDFGRKGTPPVHPELLDWLAVELMENDWSLKHLHRLLVTSAAYRMNSSNAGASANQQADEENRYYWRMNPTRMEAEVVRDSLLRLSGELDTALFGPALDPKKQESARRRSIYFFHSHTEKHRLLSIFDEANVLECYRRAQSIVPQQALALSNSRFILDTAPRINDRLHAQLGSVGDAEFIRAAFETVLCCTPTPAEQAECTQALTTLTELLAKQGRADAVLRARADLIHALVNHNDFITVR